MNRPSRTSASPAIRRNGNTRKRSRQTLIVVLLVVTLLIGVPAYIKVSADGGTLDPSFGAGGKVTTAFFINSPNTSAESISALAIQPDGKLIAAGQRHIIDGQGRVLADNVALARYNTDGSLDGSFGGAGTVFTGGSNASDVVLQSDGKIIVVGSSGDSIFVARFNANGTPDSSFGNGGRVIARIKLYNYAHTVLLQGDGKIVVGGAIADDIGASSRNDDFVLIRYNTNGSLDSNSFGVGGIATTNFAGGADVILDAALQPDNKIVVAGYANNSNNSSDDFALARYSPNGILDSTFGAGGKVTTSFATNFFYDQANSLAIQPDGKIIAGGTGGGSAFGGPLAFLRQSGATVRIAAQLVDTATGAHLWAETYDRALNSGEIFAIQDELVPRIVSTIADQHGVLVHSMMDAIRKKDKTKSPRPKRCCPFLVFTSV